MTRQPSPLPDPRVSMFHDDVMDPIWREFWLNLLAVIADLNPIGILVANLPSAATNQGARRFVTDSIQSLMSGIGAIVAGGGANAVPVVSDGVNWRIG